MQFVDPGSPPLAVQFTLGRDTGMGVEVLEGFGEVIWGVVVGSFSPQALLDVCWGGTILWRRLLREWGWGG